MGERHWRNVRAAGRSVFSRVVARINSDAFLRRPGKR